MNGTNIVEWKDIGYNAGLKPAKARKKPVKKDAILIVDGVIISVINSFVVKLQRNWKNQSGLLFLTIKIWKKSYFWAFSKK